jgi:DNA-binding transcriptional LysR family regulator
MNINHLLYFKEAAEREHMHRAAQALHVSPSTVVNAIRALESELGRRLFRKEGRNIKLTSDGERLLEKTNSILTNVFGLKDIFQGKDELRGHFRIGATHDLATDYVARVCGQIQRNHEGVSFEVLSLRSSEALVHLRSSEIDLTFCYSPENPLSVTVDEIHFGRLVICVRRGHPAVDLSARECVRMLNECGAALPRALPGIEDCANHPVFTKWKLNPKIAFRYDNYDVCAQYLRYSNCWSLVPHWIVQKYRGILRGVISDPSANVRIAAVWPATRMLPSPLRLLRDEVKKLF